MAGDKKSFSLIKRGELAYLQAPLFNAGDLVQHAFSTRTGGCSSGNLSSLNMAFHTGDHLDNVLENRSRFFKLFEADHRQIVSAIQVHGTEIAVFNHNHKGEGALPQSATKSCDALITTEPDLILSAYAADCQLLYFCALDRPLVALVHAGKQGALGRIGQKVVNYLEEQYYVRPDRLLAAMSPAVCRCCYQVGEQDAALFRQAGWDDQRYLETSGEDSFKLDLGAINLEQLLTAGINHDNIAISELCTSCNPDLFYSYRRDRGITGRMIGFIVLNTKGTAG
jgi:polyphenol oxidase